MAEMEWIATDPIPCFAQTPKLRSAWRRGAAADIASVAARGCTVIAFRRLTGGAAAP